MLKYADVKCRANEYEKFGVSSLLSSSLFLSPSLFYFPLFIPL